MGLMVDGKWVDRWYDTASHGGRFVRRQSQFRNWVTADGAPGPTGEGGFAAMPGRYHLYVSYACPWAHRTLIFRKLMKLEETVSLSVVHWLMGENGWTFREEAGATGDRLHGASYLHEIYTRAESDYSGRVTVPVLWDEERQTIVSNESSEIIRMFNDAFAGDGVTRPDFRPQDLRGEIDEVNAFVYDKINNGVYKAGFATSQEAYEDAFNDLFVALDRLEERLGRQRYLTGDRLTEADWRLFTTLVRFDAVYVGHFKCNRNRLMDMPNLWGFTRELYQIPGVAETVHLDHIKRHYYESHLTVNPTGVVPLGPDIDFSAAHDRDRLPGAPMIA